MLTQRQKLDKALNALCDGDYELAFTISRQVERDERWLVGLSNHIKSTRQEAREALELQIMIYNEARRKA